MDLLQAMKERHSVRSYDEKSIEAGTVEKLRSFIKECNKESGLHMQLVLDEPHAFEGFMAHYGKFSGVRNYIALIGRKGNDLEEKCGYYGEKIVLYAQTLGLNTCWVGLTYSKVKSAFQIDPGEKLCLVIAIGYGQTQGVSHNSKPREKVMNTEKDPVKRGFGWKRIQQAPEGTREERILLRKRLSISVSSWDLREW